VSSSVWRAPGMRGLLAMTVLAFAGFGLLLPLSPLWAVHGGADERGAGMVTATLMLFTIIAQLRVNAALAALGWGRVLALGLVLLAAPAPVQALAPDLWLILLTSAVRGLGFGILTVCGATAISLLVAPEIRGRAVGAYGLVVAVPQVALTPAAPWLVAVLGFPLVLACGAVPLIALLWTPHLGRRITASAHGDATPPPRARRPGPPTPLRIWRSLLGLLLATSAGGALLTFTTQIAPDTGSAVLTLVCLTAFAALSRWQFGALSDRFGARAFLAALLVVAAVGLGLVGVADTPVLLAVGALAVGVAYGGLQSVTLVQAFVDGEGDHHRVSVAWNVGFDLGTGLGAAGVGLIAVQSSFRTAFLAMACACVLGAIATARRPR
jgi:MFS family permease